MVTRPITFSAPMVRAILDDTKTQTRRLVKPPRKWAAKYPVLNPDAYKGEAWWWDGKDDSVGASQRCPYAPGNLLWVREAFLVRGERPVVYYRATARPETPGPWHPSIHMPRWVSRIILEVLRVRVERLQDISEEDAKAEGAKVAFWGPGDIDYGQRPWTDGPASSWRNGFANLWDSINAKRAPWASNPWVWVVEFRRVEP